MICTWKKRRAARLGSKQKRDGEKGDDIEVTIPNNFRCPISQDLIKDPVTMSSGITYDRESIEKWIEAGNMTCPLTNQVFSSLEPIPNHTVRKMIQGWCVDNSSYYGIERIPTPRIPVNSEEVLEIHSKIVAACKSKDQVGCQNLAAKIKALAMESERNKRCISANETASLLYYAFEEFSKASFDENAGVLEELLCSLASIFANDRVTSNYLSSASSMVSLVRFLKSEDLSMRRNSILVLKNIVQLDQRKVGMLSEIEGSMEALIKLIKEPICPPATKASLLVIYHMVTSSPSSNSEIIAKFVDMGLVPMLLEMQVDAERSVCEKALGVLDGICDSERGREEAYNHALTIPVLVRKIHRVSNLAMKFSVSILSKLCKNEKDHENGGGVLVEAVQRNVFDKLLLLLQIGCDERTKENATQLLKLLNVYRDRVECIDSADFKELKRPF